MLGVALSLIPTSQTFSDSEPKGGPRQLIDGRVSNQLRTSRILSKTTAASPIIRKVAQCARATGDFVNVTVTPILP